MKSRFPMMKSIVLAAALVAGISGLARADDSTIPVRQYQAWSDDSTPWQLHPPVFHKAPSSFRQTYPNGLPVNQYQAWSDESTPWRLHPPVIAEAPSSFHRNHPQGLPVSQYMAWSDDMHQWQLPGQSKTSALASTDRAAVAKSAANESLEARIAKFFHVAQAGGAPSAG